MGIAAGTCAILNPCITIIRSASSDRMITVATAAWRDLNLLDPDSVVDKNKQAGWDLPRLTKRMTTLLDDADVIAKARLLASSTKESGSWLHALPLSSVGNHLDDAALKVAVALRLGAKICSPHRCICGKEADCYGHHALSCIKSRGRSKRHASLNEVIRRALPSANIPAILEPNGLSNSDGKRPDGLTQFTWKGGKCLIWDVTCVDTVALSYIASTSANPGGAADHAEAAKRIKYAELEDRFCFVPVGFETFGSWGKSATVFVADIARQIMDRTGEPRSAEFLRQRISIEIQRGNAASVFGTTDMPKGSHDVFFLLGSDCVNS